MRASSRRPAFRCSTASDAILEFNRRVLAQARRADVPLLERLRYITIVSSNLDEFFEVRFADLLEAARCPRRRRRAATSTSVARDGARPDRRAVRTSSTTR